MRKDLSFQAVVDKKKSQKWIKGSHQNFSEESESHSSLADDYLEELRASFRNLKREKSKMKEMIDYERNKMDPSYKNSLLNKSNAFICTDYDYED